ncbi:ABC transporter ATP-binding protein, partial [Burkholderia cenocepacia]|nr:ABC transporter ATP-binding protein [Burkholderia cenocepacia]
TGTHRPGAEVAVLVRPEHVQADPPEHSANRIDGRRGEVRYFGATQRYDFIPDGSADVLLCEGREPASRSIAIDPCHLLVLPASPDAH